MLWTDKYAPQQLDEIIGHGSVVERVKQWADSWEQNQTQKALLLHGATGTGKTALALIVANQYNWELLELNASDTRNKKSIERIAGLASVSQTLSGKRRLILLDEIDGLYRQDLGGASAVYNIIKKTTCPIILTANDIWGQKLASIRGACERLEVKKVHYATISKHLDMMAKKENISIERPLLTEIARRCSGDVRSAINDLQLLAEGTDKIERKDLEILAERDRIDSIFNAVRTILKTKQFNKSRNALKRLREDPRFVLNWLDENLPKEYKRPQDLYLGYEAISKADIYLGRVYRRQSYEFWRYASDMMSAGISLSKEKTYMGFTRYAFPSVIKKLSASKGERGVRKQIALKVGEQCHVSSRVAIQDYLPMFAELMQDKEQAARYAAQFDFTEKELEFFNIKGVKKVLEQAEKIKIEHIKSKIELHKDQSSLSNW